MSNYMTHRRHLVVFIAMLFSATPDHAAQCKAQDGRYYSYTDPRCDPLLPKCTGNIAHLIAQKKINQSWMIELGKICPGAKINNDGNILVLANGNFHTFKLSSAPKKVPARPDVNYVDQIVSICGKSSLQLECLNREASLTCNSLQTGESVACLKQMEAYHLQKAKDLEQQKAAAKGNLKLKLKAIENSAR